MVTLIEFHGEARLDNEESWFGFAEFALADLQATGKPRRTSIRVPCRRPGLANVVCHTSIARLNAGVTLALRQVISSRRFVLGE